MPLNVEMNIKTMKTFKKLSRSVKRYITDDPFSYERPTQKKKIIKGADSNLGTSFKRSLSDVSYLRF